MWEMTLHNVNNNQVYRLNSGLSSLCSKPRRKFVQTSYALKSQFIGLMFVAESFSHAWPAQKATTWPPTYVKRAVRKAHFKLNQAFKVIQGHPYWCRQESRTVCCRNVQLMPTLFLKLTTQIRQRKNVKFVDFNDPTQVWRRPNKKRLRISTQGLYCQKPDLLTYILPLIVWVYVH